MTLQRTDFSEFFQTVHGDNSIRPFAWQERLLDELLSTGQWPSHLKVPTGCGKTSAILVHIFAVALMSSQNELSVPRRMALVTPRRALVDDNYDFVTKVRDIILTSDNPVVTQIRSNLVQLSPDVITVGQLRGGVSRSRSWLDDVTGCMVISATPDMWGSRVLFRGYGSSRQSRPREAGMLTNDSVVIIDEAHLNRQLVKTARRISELQATTTGLWSHNALQVVESTATTDVDTVVSTQISVTDEDIQRDSTLRRRIAVAKPLTFRTVPSWPIKDPKTDGRGAVNALVTESVRCREQYGPTVVTFVNTVRTAIVVAEALRRQGLKVVLLCGRLRGHDVTAIKSTYPGLLTLQGNSAVDVVVATQTLEVGVDIDFSSGVTELAVGTALVQRFGRINRLGLRDATEIVVVGPDTEPKGKEELYFPYHRDDIGNALSWVQARSADPTNGVSSLALMSDPAPRQSLNRILQRLEYYDLEHLSRTGETLSAVPDLSLFLKDDFQEDTDVGFVLRERLDSDAVINAVRIAQDIAYDSQEVVPVRISTARDVLSLIQSTIVRVRSGDTVLFDPAADDVRPGDLFFIDDSTVLARENVVVAIDASTPIRDASCLSDVMRIEPNLRTNPWSDSSVRTMFTSIHQWQEDTGKVLDSKAGREYITEALKTYLDLDTSILSGKVNDSEVLVHLDHNDNIVRLVLRRNVRADEVVRQVRSNSGVAVSLPVHSNAVAQRALTNAVTLSLPQPMCDTLFLSGLGHDLGKDHPLFQSVLGRETGSPPLAKSATIGRRNAKTLSGLPSGWRHEQLSVVRMRQAFLGEFFNDDLALLMEEHIDALKSVPDSDLVLRLIGTSHGHGRSSFPHGSVDLIGHHDAIAEELFDIGVWDEIVERTNHRYGFFGVAYLEALLRAADVQISKEGS